jgi:hypothetical protein
MVEIQVCIMHVTPVPISVDLSRLKHIFIDIASVLKEREWSAQHP